MLNRSNKFKVGPRAVLVLLLLVIFKLILVPQSVLFPIGEPGQVGTNVLQSHSTEAWIPMPGATLTISVITLNRLYSLRRLCESLEKAKIQTPSKIFKEVNIVFNLEASTRADTVDYVKQLEWKHGTKTIKKRVVQGGLISAVVESWYPAHDQDFGLLLEDDIEVSPFFLEWIENCLLMYRTNPEPRLMGLSLYAPRITETTNPRRRFDGNLLMEDLIGDRESPFLMQTPCSWGAIYFPHHWMTFHSYMQHRITKQAEIVSIPKSVTNGWKASWKKYMFELMYYRGLFLLYPNFENQASLSTNHLAAGEHIRGNGTGEGDATHRPEDFTVPLLSDRTKLKRIPLAKLTELPILDLFGNPWGATLGNLLNLSVPLPANIRKQEDELLMNHFLSTLGRNTLKSREHPGGVYTLKLDRTGQVNIISKCKECSKTSKTIWRSKSAASKSSPYAYKLWLRADSGSLELEQFNSTMRHFKAIWRTPPDNQHRDGMIYFAKLNSNGNFVIYEGQPNCRNADEWRVVWETGSGKANREAAPCSLQTSTVCPRIPVSLRHFGAQPGDVTLLISASRNFNLLKKQIQHYTQSARIRTIIVTVGEEINVPSPYRVQGTVVYFISTPIPSPNSRFVPSFHIDTEAVLLVEPTTLFSLQDLERMYSSWQQHPHNLIDLLHRTSKGNQGSLRKAGALLVHSDYLHLYTCGMKKGLVVSYHGKYDLIRLRTRFLVDSMFACDDLALSVLAILSNSDGDMHPIQSVIAKHKVANVDREAEQEKICKTRLNQILADVSELSLS